MIMYSLDELAAACQAQIINPKPISIGRLLTDSRHLFVAEHTLFVALRGPHHDGAHYIADLYRRGIRAFLCHTDVDTSAFAGASFLLVGDTTLALQQIAAMHRHRMPSRIVAIAGSNGKTIVKEWLSQIIADDLLTQRSPRSYNSQVGVALSLQLIEPETQLSIIEAGISQPGEMQRLADAIEPDDVIITNIGQAHQENFASIDEKLNEKLTLCRTAKRIFYCKSHTAIAQAIERNFPEAEKISWGNTTDAMCQITSTIADGKVQLIAKQGDTTINIASSLTDRMSIENMSHALCYALNLGIPSEHITQRASMLQSIGMRLEQKDGHNNCTLIDDAYNADITSLEIALDLLHVLGDRRGLSRTVILSDLQQTGLPDEVLYARVSTLLRQKNVDRLIGIGPHISNALSTQHGTQCFSSTDDFLRRMSTADFRDEAILLKGSRNFGFERITEMLEQRRHRTVMEINLNALAHNIGYFRSFLAPQTRLLAMVKAYSYGTGSFEIAKLMQQQGVDYLGVAFADEGYDLRAAGITLPIAVMNPEEHSYDLMLSHDLEPEIYSESALCKYSAAAAKAGIASAPIHIKINTGMNRSGFEVSDMQHVAQLLRRHPNLHVVSVFSHLVGSDEARFDEFSQEQIGKFEAAAAELHRYIGYDFMRHILNSAGIERFNTHQCEMVRLGIGLYGVSAVDNSKLRNVATLKSYIAQIHDNEAGESVGYSRKTILTRHSRIAVVPIGYADGLDRRLSNGVGEVIIRGHKAPIAGNVCMDICMVDVTDIPDACEGDEVILFGDENPVWDMAERIGTISYEVLTGIGRRVKRVYYVD